MTPDDTPATLTGADLDALRAFLATQPAPQPWPEFVAEIEPSFAICTRDYHKRFRNTCDKLAELGVETTFDLTPQMIARFIASRPPGQSEWTLWGYLLMLRTICNHASRNRRLIASPFVGVPIGKVLRLGKPKGKRHLTRAEIGRLFEVLRADIERAAGWQRWKARRLHVAVAIGLYCGLRKMELLRLEVADLDLDARLIRLTPHAGTGRFKTASSEQPVPIAGALVPIIEDWLSHRLDHPTGFRMPPEVPYLIPTCSRKAAWTGGCERSKPLYQLKDAAARAGIEHITLHMLRRSCATHLEATGVPRSLVSRILRHSGEKVTEDFYMRRDEEVMVAAVKDLVF